MSMPYFSLVKYFNKEILNFIIIIIKTFNQSRLLNNKNNKKINMVSQLKIIINWKSIMIEQIIIELLLVINKVKILIL